jgi:hypothetical protein
MHKQGTKIGTFVIVISMIGASAWAEPLAAGKPAGVKKAQMGGTEWAVIGGIAALGAGILIAIQRPQQSRQPGSVHHCYGPGNHGLIALISPSRI